MNRPAAEDSFWSIDLDLIKKIGVTAFIYMLPHLGMSLFFIVDLAYLGRVSEVDLAGAGLAAATIINFYLFGIGCLFGFDTLATQALGRGDRDSAATAFFNATILAICISLPCSIFLGQMYQLFELFGIKPEIIAASMTYLTLARWVILPFLIFNVAKQFLTAVDRPRVLILAVVLGNLSNAILGYAFVLGNFGFPQMGLRGASFATLFSNSVMAICLMYYVYINAPALGFSFWKLKFNRAVFTTLVKIGIPAGFQLLIEAGMISLMAYVVGGMNATLLAAHSIAVNVFVTYWSAPFGISVAAVLNTGNAVGAGDVKQSIKVAKHCIFTGVAWWGLVFAVTYVFADSIVGFYTSDLAIQKISSSILIVATGVHLLDGLAVILIAILRGKGETQLPLYLNVLGYWMVTPALTYYFYKYTNTGIYGIWGGYAAGLLVIVTGLFVSWYRNRNVIQSAMEEIKSAA